MERKLTPFVKWAGGKRKLLTELHRYQPKQFNKYYEPFIGGGAYLLSLQPKNAKISDLNEELIKTWNSIKNSPEELLTILNKHQIENSKDYYLHIRNADRDGRLYLMTDVERAARFIYLNKAGFNGLWRVNKKGQNNVPFANPKSLKLINYELIVEISKYLNQNKIEIYHQDYIDSVEEADLNDFVYFDPPYIPINKTSSFTSYTSNGFNLEEQIKLKNLAIRLAKKGVYVMLSNSSSPLVYELYNDELFNIYEVITNRVINSNTDKRGKIKELIITTY